MLLSNQYPVGTISPTGDGGCNNDLFRVFVSFSFASGHGQSSKPSTNFLGFADALTLAPTENLDMVVGWPGRGIVGLGRGNCDVHLSRFSSLFSRSPEFVLFRSSQFALSRPSQVVLLRPSQLVLSRPSQFVLLRPSQSVLVRPCLVEPSPSQLRFPQSNRSRVSKSRVSQSFGLRPSQSFEFCPYQSSQPCHPHRVCLSHRPLIMIPSTY